MIILSEVQNKINRALINDMELAGERLTCKAKWFILLRV